MNKKVKEALDEFQKELDAAVDQCVEDIHQHELELDSEQKEMNDDGQDKTKQSH